MTNVVRIQLIGKFKMTQCKVLTVGFCFLFVFSRESKQRQHLQTKKYAFWQLGIQSLLPPLPTFLGHILICGLWKQSKQSSSTHTYQVMPCLGKAVQLLKWKQKVRAAWGTCTGNTSRSKRKIYSLVNRGTCHDRDSEKNLLAWDPKKVTYM